MNRTLRAFLRFSMIVLLTGTVTRCQDVVLSGTVVTPSQVISKGWVVIKGDRIDSILDKPPDGPVIQTHGIIFPGFIDLHNHPMYDIFKRWTPKVKFSNRYEWRDLQEYKNLIGTPGGALQHKSDQTFCDVDEYAEVKALIGGTTSITGISTRGGNGLPVPSCLTGLVRNLDWASGFYGSGIGHERIENLLGVAPRDATEINLQKIRTEIANGEIDLLLVHLAEGSPRDTESTLEFRALNGVGLLGKHTVIIHGTALSTDDFRQMRLSGTALVWSPRSNMELYGETTNVNAAFEQGVTIALAPDWSPTGSTNMLEELQFASRLSRKHLFSLFSDREVFEMATAIPARVAHLEDKVGTLAPGLSADLFVLAGDRSQPFEALASAHPPDVKLVLIRGVPMYGTEKLVSQFGVPTESVEVCKTKMVLNSQVLPAGKFSDVEARLKSDLGSYNLELSPLEEKDDCAR